MTSLAPFHPMVLRARLGPENRLGLQGKEDDCSMVIQYSGGISTGTEENVLSCGSQANGLLEQNETPAEEPVERKKLSWQKPSWCLL